MLYRIDTFSLPEAARPEFKSRSRETIALLRKQPGFIRDDWFEKVVDDGSFNVVTMVEWRDEASIRSAGEAVRAMHAANGFDAADFFRRNGIVASRAVYRSRDLDIPASPPRA
jgi:heme-degrading monooxygenase HmoA